MVVLANKGTHNKVPKIIGSGILIKYRKQKRRNKKRG
jgi:hypothetical protein